MKEITILTTYGQIAKRLYYEIESRFFEHAIISWYEGKHEVSFVADGPEIDSLAKEFRNSEDYRKKKFTINITEA